MIAWRGVATVDLERSIEKQHAAGAKHARRAGDEPFGRGPWRDVNHVAARHHIGALDRPALRRHVEHKRRQEVGRVGCVTIGTDAGQRVGIGIGRLPEDGRQSFGKIDRMLAAAAGNFEHQPARRQDAAQHVEDRIAVADHVRIGNAGVGRFGHAD